jgi:hydroxymethylpyrimidine/phosphomethylpyrimidine kinase
VRAVVADIGVDAVKVGMLGTVEVTRAVAQALAELPPGIPVVVDPVMVAESGARLLQESAQLALVEEILPRATVLTPNLPEARVLTGWTSIGGSALAEPAGTKARGVEARGVEARGTETQETKARGAEPQDREAMDAEVQQLARAVLAMGPRIVVLTGGHRKRAVDLFVDSREGTAVEIPGERHPDGAAHGSGCTHSAVLAAVLALGGTPLQAARAARRLTGEAVAQGLRDLGAGAGPVDIVGLERLRSGIIE